MSTGTIKIKLCKRVTCPHCWHGFPPEEVFWISQHPDLNDDHKVEILGHKDQRRFLPMRFNIDGDALDARGFACHKLACPNCHLPIPRAMLEMEPLFMSVIGSPGSGKSVFMTAMTWQLGQNLTPHFRLSFDSADADLNGPLVDNENLLFLPGDRNLPVAIDKTHVGDSKVTNTVLINRHPVVLPRPFLFSIRPQMEHPNFAQASKASRVICMYDNAGENFQRGVDTATSPVIRHLVQAKLLFFIFDPTKDRRFRDACREHTSDPQMQDDVKLERQDQILAVAANCIRQHRNLPAYEHYDRPLIVVVNKYDVWAPLVGNHRLSLKMLMKPGQGGMSKLDLDLVHQVSSVVRDLLRRYSPELVNAAEGFAREVIYIPCSPLGGSPQRVGESFCAKPSDIKPVWAEVPLLYALSRWVGGLVPYSTRAKAEPGREPPPSPSGISSGGPRAPTRPPTAPTVKLHEESPPDDSDEDEPRVWKEA